jgi:hypothetical protein
VFQIGESLREARSRRGYAPADVHKAIRIRERYLTALEEERWDMLPGEAYTKGFLRTYAEHLGLNGQLYVDEYNARVAGHEEEPPLVSHAGERRRPGRGVLGALVGVVVVGAAVAGLAAWRLGGAAHTPAQAAQGSGAGSVAAAAPAPAPATAKARPKAALPAAPAFTLITASRGRCWLLVRAGGPNGTILYEGILQPGQSQRFRLARRLWVRMGKPSALDIRVGGKLVSGLPGTPENLLLTPSGAVPA